MLSGNESVPDGFLPWSGGKTVEIETVNRAGRRQRHTFIELVNWEHNAESPEHDIVAYRIIPAVGDTVDPLL